MEVSVNSVEKEQPLAGWRILVTRPREQSRELCDIIEQLGGEAVIFPTIRIEDPLDSAPLDQAIRRLNRYEWIVFTSVNGVKCFMSRMAALLGKDWQGSLAHTRIAAIGPKTAKALTQNGLSVDVLPEEYRAEALLEALAGQVAPGDRLLLPRADIARKVLPEGLRQLGCEVTEVDAYRVVRERNRAQQVAHLLTVKRIHVVTFTSPSTVKHFVQALDETSSQWREALDTVHIGCIGPVTADSVRALIREPDVVAEDYTVSGLATAICSLRAQREG